MSRKFVSAVLLVSFVSTVIGDDGGKRDGKRLRDSLKEPVLRVSKANKNDPKSAPAPAAVPMPGPAAAAVDPTQPHPLDPAIKMAKEGLEVIRNQVLDYSCTLVKQERIDGQLYPQEYMYAEFRNHKEAEGRVVSPFSVYMYWLKPDDFKGREVLYVEGQNDGKLVALDSGRLLRTLGKVHLPPTGPIAMKGNRHPITEAGIENLISQLVVKGERDRHHGECTVEFKKDVKINGRTCTMLEVVHPYPRPHFEFHIARVYIDDQLNLPIRYEAHTWPTVPGGQPELLECYTYLNLKVNQGLQAANFTPDRFRR